MARLLGKYCLLQALFLFPLTLRILGDALSTGTNSEIGSGAWIFFTGMCLLMIVSGWYGLKFARR